MRQAEWQSLLFFTSPSYKEQYSALDSARFKQNEMWLSDSPCSFILL